jgi:glycosyltransferase involved in cell wall biosynthesis
MRVHLIVPDGFDDPARPSGGNIYDQRICAGLAQAGWDVQIAVAARPGTAGCAALATILAAIPDGASVLIDGLLASPAAGQLVPHAGRLRITVLLHMPLATAVGHGAVEADRCSERAVLAAAAGVIVPSQWTRAQVLDRCGVAPGRVHVALPGTDPAPGPARPVPGSLLCVGPVAPHKGQDILVAALARLAGRDWQLLLAGPPDADPGFSAALRASVDGYGLAGRVRLAGVLAGPDLADAYAAADLLVAPSLSETYGMAVTEALARGVPVIAADTGGLPEALGCTARGEVPGQLVPPGDPAALAAALARWLDDPCHRGRLRAAAGQRRTQLRGWDQATADIAAALRAAAVS